MSDGGATWYFYVSEKWGEYWSKQHPAYCRDKFVGSVESAEHPRKTLYSIQNDQAQAFGDYCNQRAKEILDIEKIRSVNDCATTTPVVERVARALSDQRQKHRYGSVMTPWGDQAMADSFRREQLELARAAIDACFQWPKHDCDLHLTHNQHKAYYQTVEQACEEKDFGYSLRDWVSEEQKQKAIKTNDCWTLQWYPDTPNGFHILAAADLAVLLDAALGRGGE